MCVLKKTPGIWTAIFLLQFPLDLHDQPNKMLELAFASGVIEPPG